MGTLGIHRIEEQSERNPDEALGARGVCRGLSSDLETYPHTTMRLPKLNLERAMGIEPT